MSSIVCICGCGKSPVIWHHVIYQQELRRVAGRDDALAERLRGDERGMVPMAQSCHERHHSRSAPLPLSALPDAAYVFAVEVLGVGRAFNYLRRLYAGDDPRLTALLLRKDAA